MDRAFPLTPALFLWERENNERRFGDRFGNCLAPGPVEGRGRTVRQILEAGRGLFTFVIRGKDGLFGARDAAADGKRFEASLLNRRVYGNIGAEFVQAGAEVNGSLEEEFRSHVLEAVLLQSLLDAGQVTGELLKFLFISRSVFFLKFFDLHAFNEVDFSPTFTVPMEDGGFGDAQFVGDFAEAPAVGTKEHEGGLLFGGVHKSEFLISE